MNRCVSRPYNAGTSSYRPRSSRIARISTDSRAARANVPRSLTTLLKDDKPSGEAHSRDGEIHGAIMRSSGQAMSRVAAREKTNWAKHEMRRGKDLHGVLQPDHAFPGRRRAGHQLHGEERENEKQRELQHGLGQCSQAIPIVIVRAGTESLKCQAPDRRSG
jgi:hypothetical protein